MSLQTTGIHHITAFAGNPQEALEPSLLSFLHQELPKGESEVARWALPHM